MINRLTTGWTLMRGLYLVMGLLIAIQAGIEQSWWIMGIGAYFAAMGLFGFGCAGGHCATPVPRETPTSHIERENQ